LPTALVIALLAGTLAFFFAATRGALILRATRGAGQHPAPYIYPIYSNKRLIRLIDFQPIVAAILLFQYDRLVTIITRRLSGMNLSGRQVLITSCAFGNVMPRVAQAAFKAGARQVQVVDIIDNELLNAQRKMAGMGGPLSYLQQDATALSLPDGSVHANVIFFLLHELPHDLKGEVVSEACRVLAPGGQLFIAEFHRPGNPVMRALS
jgi:ubiquinone/menaquinone biosynthesis C-methylase UbiE